MDKWPIVLKVLKLLYIIKWSALFQQSSLLIARIEWWQIVVSSGTTINGYQWLEWFVSLTPSAHLLAGWWCQPFWKIVSWEGFSHSTMENHIAMFQSPPTRWLILPIVGLGLPGVFWTIPWPFHDHFNSTCHRFSTSKRLGSGRQGVATVPGGDDFTSDGLPVVNFLGMRPSGKRFLIVYRKLWEEKHHAIFMGQSTISTGPLSIAMLNYQRVTKACGSLKIWGYL